MEAIKTTLQKLDSKLQTNSTGHLVRVEKKEKRPNFINSDEMLALYNKSDLEFTEVLTKLGELQVLKDISVDFETKVAFYLEFLRMGWNSFRFRTAYQAVKSTNLYNKFDIATWINSQPVFTAEEINQRVSQIIDSTIRKGESLKNKTALLPHELKMAKFSAIKLFESQNISLRYELIEKERDEILVRLKQEYKEAKIMIENMTAGQKDKLYNYLVESGLIKPAGEFEKKAIKKNISFFADKFPKEYLRKIKDKYYET